MLGGKIQEMEVEEREGGWKGRWMGSGREGREG